MVIELRPVQVETGSPDEEGRLVFRDGRLIALLVQLGPLHNGCSGRWVVEWMGEPTLIYPQPFRDLDGAQQWLATH